MPLPFIIGGALAGGAINALSGIFGANSQNDNINKYEDLLRQSKLSSGDITLGDKKIERFYNASITNLMNRSAINTGGLLNSPVVKAATVAPLAGQSALAQSNYDIKASAYNSGIDRQIASAELGRPTNNVLGDFFGGAVSGGIAGAQISSLLPKSDNIPVTPIAQTAQTAQTVPDLSASSLDTQANNLSRQVAGNSPSDLLNLIPTTPTPIKTKISDVNLGSGGRVEQPYTVLDPNNIPTPLEAGVPLSAMTDAYKQKMGLNEQPIVPPPQPIPSSTQSYGPKDYSNHSSLPMFYGQPSFGGSSIINYGDPLPQRPYNPLEILNGIKDIFNFGAKGLDWLGNSVWQGLSKERR